MITEMNAAETIASRKYPPLSRRLRLGFIPLNDAAPLIVAYEFGFFRKQGLEIELSREVGWATIRDKIIYGELEGAHALGSMVLSTALGLNCQPTPCLTACILNQNGNAITLSEDLWKRGVRDAETFREQVAVSKRTRPLVLGVVYPYSTHRILLSEWLRSCRVDPDRDVRIVVVPPPQLYRNLAAGTIDGYCAGEPWNTLAVQKKAGWIVATSADVSPGHPEKVFMVHASFAEDHHAEHLGLIKGLLEATELCEQAAFQPELCRLLSQPGYLNVSEAIISQSLIGPLDRGHGESHSDRHVRFHGAGVNDPTPATATWLMERMQRHGLFPSGMQIPLDLARRTFRSDLFHQAKAREARV